MSEGAVLLIDMADPLTGQLLRSFARSTGLPYVTLLDKATLIEKDFNPDLHIQIEPPGSVLMGVVRDVITHEHLTGIAVLYDNSFGEHFFSPMEQEVGGYFLACACLTIYLSLRLSVCLSVDLTPCYPSACSTFYLTTCT